MGRSDPVLKDYYFQRIKPKGKTALLGYTHNNWFQGDLYDLQLDNWDINSKWTLPQKYDTIVCTRCAYFGKDLNDFFTRCYNNLTNNGEIFIDFGLGDHWRFKNYKIGWVKNGEHEHAYKDNNFLWSTVWDESFLEDEQYKLFEERVKSFKYNNVKQAIFNEVPTVLELKEIEDKFNISTSLLALWTDSPQLYILLKGIKKQA
tara:strand:- start:16238 stop:16846 length:609 start_codon:yes stop_codon:yes gene_type:complete